LNSGSDAEYWDCLGGWQEAVEFREENEMHDDNVEGNVTAAKEHVDS